MIITRIQAIAIIGSLYFLIPDGVCWETGSFVSGADDEYTVGDSGVTGGGDACGRYVKAVCCAGSWRDDPQFSQERLTRFCFHSTHGAKGHTNHHSVYYKP